MYISRRAPKKRKTRRKLLIWETVLALLLAMLTGFALEEPEDAPLPAAIVFRGQLYAAPPGKTAIESLGLLGLEAGPEDVLSLPQDAVLMPGSLLRVDRVQQRQEVYTQVLSAETQYLPDPAAPLGQESVLQEGSPGELRCTALTQYVNGIPTGSTVTQRELIRPPEDRIVSVGVRQDPEAADISGGQIRLPNGLTLSYTGALSLSASAFPGGEFQNQSSVPVGSLSADPSVIPPGTRVFVAADDFTYGIAIAQPGISGNRIELHFPTSRECMEFGQRACTVYFLG